MRAARSDDPAAGLLYVSAAPYYDRYAGGEAHARRLLALPFFAELGESEVDRVCEALAESLRGDWA